MSAARVHVHVLAGSGGRRCDAARASLRWLQRWRHVHRGAGGGLQRAGRRQVLLRRLEGNLPRYVRVRIMMHTAATCA